MKAMIEKTNKGGGGDKQREPDDLLNKIFIIVPEFIDHTIQYPLGLFSLTCKTHSQVFQSPQSPHLMIPFHDQDPDHRSYFSFEGDRVHHLELREARGNYVCGSSGGWLVLLEHNTPSISLLNPLTKHRIKLPPLTSFPELLKFSKRDKRYLWRFSDDRHFFSQEFIQKFFVSKIVLSSKATTRSYTAMAIFGIRWKKLAVCRPGDKRWILVKGIGYAEHNDILYYNGRFYVSVNGAFFVISKSLTASPKVEQIYFSVPYTLQGKYSRREFLIEISGDLFLVVREKMFDRCEAEDDGYVEWYKTKRFEVFKLDHRTRKSIKMDSIGDYALFVGGSSSVSVSVKEFPECRADCIYFTDDFLRIMPSS